MEIEIWPVERPREYRKNPRKIPQEAIDRVATSIREYGFKQPLVCDENDTIIIGHTRLRAAKKLALTEVPVHVAHGLTAEQVRGLRIMDNRAADASEFDEPLLLSEILDLNDLNFDLSLTGFDATAIHELTNPKDEESEQNTDGAGNAKNTLKFTDEQWETVLRAIYKLRDEEQDTNISDQRAVELICADYAA